MDQDEIIKLRHLLNEFDFGIIDESYSFIYENAEVIISKSGTVLISLISASNVSESISLLMGLAKKLNTIIKVESFLTEINIYDREKLTLIHLHGQGLRRWRLR